MRKNKNSPGRKRPARVSKKKLKIDVAPQKKLEELEARKKINDLYIKLGICAVVGILGFILALGIAAKTSGDRASDANWGAMTVTEVPDKTPSAPGNLIIWGGLTLFLYLVWKNIIRNWVN